MVNDVDITNDGALRCWDAERGRCITTKTLDVPRPAKDVAISANGDRVTIVDARGRSHAYELMKVEDPKKRKRLAAQVARGELTLIKLREVYGWLEETVDACKDVALVISEIVIKGS